MIFEKTFHKTTLNRLNSVKAIFSCILFILLFSKISLCQKSVPNKIIYGGDFHFPPYEYIDKKGNPVGFNVDLIKAIADEMKFEVEIKLGVWSDIRNEFEIEHSVHITDMYYYKDREKIVEYADAHEVNYDEIYVRKGGAKISSIEGLNHKSVAIQSGSTIEEYVISKYPEINIIPVQSEPDALKYLANGECDAAIVSRIIAYDVINNLEIKNLVSIGQPFLPRPLSFVVIKGNRQLLELINIGLFRLKESGKFSEIREKWFKQEKKSWIYEHLPLAGGLILAIFIITYTLIISLRLIVTKRTKELNFIISRLNLISNLKTFRIDKYSAKDQTLEFLEQIKNVFDVDYCSIHLLIKNQLILQAGIGINSLRIPEFLSTNNNFINEIIEHKKTVSISKNYPEDFQSIFPDNQLQDFKNGLFSAAPLIVEEKITGILLLFSRIKKQKFNEIDLKHLQIVANQAGFLVENARLFEQNEKQKEILVKQMVIRKKAEQEIKTLNLVLEQRVNERTSELEHINKELESFSYSVSHDLKAPLRTITGFSQILLDQYSAIMDEQGRTYLNRLREGANLMSNLIKDLLNLSRITRTKKIVSELNLSAIIQSFAYEYQNNDTKRKANFIIQPDLYTIADLALMRILVQNLLDNAWKFTSKKPKAIIEFGQLQINEENVFFIRDNGSGFDMKYANKLFIPFNRLHTADEFEGTGIGLATAHRIISRHNGKIWVESEIDKGTTFYFTISS